MCATGKHCETAAAPAAYHDTCVQCVNDGQCGVGTTKCAKTGDAAQDTCVECVDNTTCSNPKPVCKTGVGAYTCVECVAMADCTVPAKPNCVANVCQ
jgi:hypothetical protein